MSGEGIERPEDYAPSRVRERLLPWWRGAAGEAVRRWGPVVWPDVPPVALLAWSVTAQGPHELGGAPDYVVGLYGVERARLPGLLVSAEATLGRDVSGSLTPSGYLGDVEAQVVVGLLNYQEHLDRVTAKADDCIMAAMGAASSATWRAAAWAYSSGGRRARALLGATPDALLNTPPKHWGASLGALVATMEVGARIGGEPVAGKWRLAFMVLRGEQRAQAAWELGRQVLGGEELAKLDAWLGRWAANGAATVERLKELADASV